MMIKVDLKRMLKHLFDSVPDVSTRIPIGKIMKAKYVRDLIGMQEKKNRH